MVRIDFSGEYLVKTEASAAPNKTYELYSDSEACSALFSGQPFYFYDRTGAALRAARGTLCDASVGSQDLIYENVDACSADLGRARVTAEGSALTLVQWSCLDYAFPAVEFATLLGADALTYAWADDVFDVNLTLGADDAATIRFGNATQ